MTNKDIKKALKERLKQDITGLEKDVIKDILSHEDMQVYIGCIMSYGCINGVVSGLIYCDDVKVFFKKHSLDIINLYEGVSEEHGQCPTLKYPYYNSMTWLAYEETARRIDEYLQQLKNN